MSRFKYLFSPLKVGTHTYKNRIIAAPIYCGTFINIPGVDYMMQHGMRMRAMGGAAQVTIGETPVNFKEASRELVPPIDYSNFHDPAMAKLKDLVSFIKNQGAVCMIEISHCGESIESISGVKSGVGPMGYHRDDGIEIRGMDKDMMQTVICDFIQTARFMKEAGMDGVMVHCGHGWLLHQFLSPRTNRRKDEFGGSLENRSRFPLMLLKSLREAMGENFLIEIRVSGEEAMGEPGMHIDETVEFCKMAQRYVDLIHVSVGTYRNPILSGEFSTIFHRHGLNMDNSEKIKEAVDIPVVVVGGINDPALAEEMIASEKCDFVALARQLTADPYFPKKAREGREADINPCIRCFKCFPGPLEEVDDADRISIYGCSVNPEEANYNQEILSTKPEQSKNVLVVGGGVAGMTAAITAFDRGHRVTLVDNRERLGGVLFFTDTDSYKEDIRRFRDVLIQRVENRNIELQLNRTIMPEDIKSSDADVVILALGAKPVRPAIRGIDYAHHALDFYSGYLPAGKEILMIGGGLVGCETALDLAKKGYEVTVLEMGEKPAPDSYPMHQIGLLNEMEKMIHIKCGLKCVEIAPGSVTCMNQEGKEVIFKGDDIIFALGMRADSENAEVLKAASGVPIVQIGDCVKAGKIFEAGRSGWEAAMKIL